MSMLSKINISRRISFGYFSILLLLVIVAGAEYYGLSQVGSNFLAFDKISENVGKIMMIDRNIVALRRNVQTFLASGNTQSQKEIHDYLTKLEKDVAQAADDADRAESKAALQGIGKLLEEYSGAFGKAERLRVMIGLTPNDGLSGEMRQAVHNLESALSSQSQDKILVQMLLLRRLEKDFLLRGDEKYISEHEAKSLAFVKSLGGLPKSGDAVAQAQVYANSFLALAKANKELNDLSKGPLTTTAKQMGSEISQIVLAETKRLEEIGASSEAGLAISKVVSLVLAIGAAAMGSLLALFVSRSIVVPLKRMTETMNKLSQGDKTVEIPATENTDEIGDMARAVLVFKENMIKADQLAAEQARQQQLQIDRAKKIHELTEKFDVTVTGTVQGTASSATEMQSTAESMSAIAEQTQRQATAVAAASEEASSNVQTVAAAAEELSSSIHEISRQVSQSTQVAQGAAEEAERANAMVQGLADAASKIGEVVHLINDIASQTNLLALNATIEAARAGDAGKGFAVVANEVKSLANQTAKATDEISQQIASVQGATQDAVTAIQSITKVISQVNEISTAIASAVEEQGAATQEIARNAQQASGATAEVSGHINGVTQGASETGKAAGHVLEAAETLTKQAELLRKEVDDFLADVKVA
jgi:methyl-accepting chemotaxis protein